MKKICYLLLIVCFFSRPLLAMDTLYQHICRNEASNNKSIAELFLGYPYISTPLPSNDQFEAPQTQKAHLSLEGFDCMTLVETVIALNSLPNNLFACSNKANFYKALKQAILKNRYFTDTCTYKHRKHYLSQYFQGLTLNAHYTWLNNPNSLTRRNHLTFLDSILTPDQPQIAKQIAIYAKLPTQTPQSLKYYPCDMQTKDKQLLTPGTLIGFVSNIKGLDFNHTAILHNTTDYRFIHASSITDNITISKRSVFQYCKENKKTIGLVFLIPNNQ